MIEATATRLGRRLLTIPLYLLMAVALLGALPLVLPLAVLGDLVLRRRFALARCLLFFVVYLVCEGVGIAAAGALWLVALVRGDAGSAADLARHYALQRRWAKALLAAGAHLFGFRLELRLEDGPGTAPVIVFMRHASVADTVLPAAILSDRFGLRLRYVLKRELLLDPCLDLVGNRLPNCFVRRGSGEAAREVAAVVALLDGLGPRDGVLIYPEGTRFTPEKRARLLARLEASGDVAALERARAFSRVLPPRPGGPLALLDANPGADVLFVAHAGFEAASTFWELLGGALVGRTVRVETWRVPFADLPRDAAGRQAWLQAQWLRMDAWVAAHAPRTVRATRPALAVAEPRSHA